MILKKEPKSKASNSVAPIITSNGGRSFEAHLLVLNSETGAVINSPSMTGQ